MKAAAFAVCLTWLSAASAADSRFVEFPDKTGTAIYDLGTVQIIQPGRFSIVSTEIDHPDVMQLKLNALGILRTYCGRPPGDYPAPATLFSMGSPDLPVEKIEVTRKDSVWWYYPYKRLSYGEHDEQLSALIACRGPDKTDGWFLQQRAEITNGKKTKHVFDCERGLSGWFFPGDDDPSKVMTTFVKPNSVGEMKYFRVCMAVTHKKAYLPNR